MENSPPAPLSISEARSYLSSSFPANGTKCGSLKCQHDSNIKSISTAISGIVKVKPEDSKVRVTFPRKEPVRTRPFFTCFPPLPIFSQSKGKKKKTIASPQKNTKTCYLITCLDSVIFPMGGGQPCDYGTLLVPSHSLSFEVLDSSNVGGTCVLTCYCQEEDITDASSLVGQPCTMTVDFVRRMDHMQQHTAQHVISAIALDKFKVSVMEERTRIGWCVFPPN